MIRQIRPSFLMRPRAETQLAPAPKPGPPAVTPQGSDVFSEHDRYDAALLVRPFVLGSRPASDDHSQGSALVWPYIREAGEPDTAQLEPDDV